MHYNSYRSNTGGSGNTDFDGDTNGSMGLPDQLNSQLANFKHDRDDWLRKHEVSAKRLHLAQQDRDGLAKDVQEKEDKLAELEKQKSGGAEAELIALESAVKMLQYEANYQHSDLVGKREKLDATKEKMENDAKVRQIAARTSHEKTAQLRKHLAVANGEMKIGNKKNRRRHWLSFNDGVEMNEKTARELLEIETNDLDGDRLWKHWPRIVEQKADSVQKEADVLFRSNEEIARILEGYKRQFGLKIDSDDVAEVMQQLLSQQDENEDEGEDAGMDLTN